MRWQHRPAHSSKVGALQQCTARERVQVRAQRVGSVAEHQVVYSRCDDPAVQPDNARPACRDGEVEGPDG